jgi:hypothetical protein
MTNVRGKRLCLRQLKAIDRSVSEEPLRPGTPRDAGTLARVATAARRPRARRAIWSAQANACETSLRTARQHATPDFCLLGLLAPCSGPYGMPEPCRVALVCGVSIAKLNRPGFLAHLVMCYRCAARPAVERSTRPRLLLVGCGPGGA